MMEPPQEEAVAIEEAAITTYDANAPKSKRSDDNRRNAHFVKSALKREVAAVEKCGTLQDQLAQLDHGLSRAQEQVKKGHDHVKKGDRELYVANKLHHQQRLCAI